VGRTKCLSVQRQRAEVIAWVNCRRRFFREGNKLRFSSERGKSFSGEPRSKARANSWSKEYWPSLPRKYSSGISKLSRSIFLCERGSSRWTRRLCKTEVFMVRENLESRRSLSSIILDLYTIFLLELVTFSSRKDFS
jgi:hypothetical protein